MKKITNCILVLAMLILTAFLTGCDSSNNDIQGVTVTESGEVAVTFKLPSTKKVEDVIGSEIGDENIFYVTDVTGSTNKGSYAYWYSVDNGGILSKNGSIYRYSPDASVSHATGVAAPPSWVMLYKTPSEDEILDPNDVELLKEQYGIELNLK